MNVSPGVAGTHPTSGFTRNRGVGTHQAAQAFSPRTHGELLQVKACPLPCGDTSGHVRQCWRPNVSPWGGLIKKTPTHTTDVGYTERCAGIITPSLESRR
jgi:hypothetical protein